MKVLGYTIDKYISILVLRMWETLFTYYFIVSCFIYLPYDIAKQKQKESHKLQFKL